MASFLLQLMSRFFFMYFCEVFFLTWMCISKKLCLGVCSLSCSKTYTTHAETHTQFAWNNSLIQARLLQRPRCLPFSSCSHLFFSLSPLPLLPPLPRCLTVMTERLTDAQRHTTSSALFKGHKQTGSHRHDNTYTVCKHASRRWEGNEDARLTDI